MKGKHTTLTQILNEHAPKIVFSSLISEETSKVLQSIQRKKPRADMCVGNQEGRIEFANRCKAGYFRGVGDPASLHLMKFICIFMDKNLGVTISFLQLTEL